MGSARSSNMSMGASLRLLAARARATARWPSTGRRLAALVASVGLSVVLVGAAPPAAIAPPPGRPDAGAAATSVAADVVPPALDDIEHMCALLTSCPDVPIPTSLVPRDFAACVRQMAGEMASASAVGFSLTIRECGLRSNSCAALRTCALRGARPDVCAGRGKASAAGFCDADGRAISCWHEKVLAVRDCPRGGEQCAVREGEALCTLGPCPPGLPEGAPSTCSASGTRVLRCERGRVASLDCAAFGLRCWNGVGDGGGAACGTSEPTCTTGPSTVRRCEGATAVGCANGHEVRVDCGAAGLACNTSQASAMVGACATGGAAADAGGAACDPATAAAKCEGGSSISYCVAGKTRTYFCKSLGFARCASDGKTARCAG